MQRYHATACLIHWFSMYLLAKSVADAQMNQPNSLDDKKHSWHFIIQWQKCCRVIVLLARMWLCMMRKMRLENMTMPWNAFSALIVHYNSLISGHTVPFFSLEALQHNRGTIMDSQIIFCDLEDQRLFELDTGMSCPQGVSLRKTKKSNMSDQQYWYCISYIYIVHIFLFIYT